MTSRKYYTEDTALDKLDYLTKKFASDLRRYIKRIDMRPVFSKEWLTVTELLEHICKVAILEVKTAKQGGLVVQRKMVSTPGEGASNLSNTNSTTGGNGNGSGSSPGGSFAEGGFGGGGGGGGGTRISTSGANLFRRPAGGHALSGLLPQRPKSSTGRSRIITGASTSSFSSASSSSSSGIILPRKVPIGESFQSSSGVRGQKPIQTLWDRKSEHTVRLLLEEGKINMMLRYLNEFKRCQAQTRQAQNELEQHATSLGINVQTLKDRMHVFEVSLGTLLYICYEQSIEALQTSDIAALIGHIEMVLRNALADTFEPPQDFRSTQEVLVFGYLSLFLKKSSTVDEDTIARNVLEREIFPLTVQVIGRLGERWSPRDKFMATESLSQLVDSEIFKSKRDEFWQDLQLKHEFLALHDSVVKSLLKDYESKRALRALTNEMIRIR